MACGLTDGGLVAPAATRGNLSDRDLVGAERAIGDRTDLLGCDPLLVVFLLHDVGEESIALLSGAVDESRDEDVQPTHLCLGRSQPLVEGDRPVVAPLPKQLVTRLVGLQVPLVLPLR